MTVKHQINPPILFLELCLDCLTATPPHSHLTVCLRASRLAVELSGYIDNSETLSREKCKILKLLQFGQ